MTKQKGNQMTVKQKIKSVCDAAIIVLAVLVLFGAWYLGMGKAGLLLLAATALVCMIAAVADLFHQRGQAHGGAEEAPAPPMRVCELILLDEGDKPVKSWNIAGKTAVIIGRKNEEEEVDVDLEECEFGTFIDPQHAALNFCLDSWYVEDLGSVNGVRIRKAEDGICYKVTGRPCRIHAGDIVYIANTRLLLT